MYFVVVDCFTSIHYFGPDKEVKSCSEILHVPWELFPDTMETLNHLIMLHFFKQHYLSICHIYISIIYLFIVSWFVYSTKDNFCVFWCRVFNTYICPIFIKFLNIFSCTYIIIMIFIGLCFHRLLYAFWWLVIRNYYCIIGLFIVW
jgi:hypothetical protein